MKIIKPISDPALRVKEVACDDLIIIMRPVKNELGSITEYEAHTIQANNFCSSFITQTLVSLCRELPKTDPQDGVSLWNNNGCICIASDPVANAFL